MGREFFLLDALKGYKWYWRIEPGVNFYCDLTYDPFAEMSRHGKMYGWTIGLWELSTTVPSLFRLSTDYKEEHKLPTSGLWKAVTWSSWIPLPFRILHDGSRNRDKHGDMWNLCQFWSNFEI